MSDVAKMTEIKAHICKFIFNYFFKFPQGSINTPGLDCFIIHCALLQLFNVFRESLLP